MSLVAERALRVEPSQVDVLVVDDSEDIRTSLAEIFTSAGYSTATAANGVEALESLSRASVGVMVLDMHMPGLDGPSLLGILEDAPRVVVLTASPPDEFGPLPMKVAAFLQKPADPAHLLQVVSRCLGAWPGRSGD